jgi:hypothetical protein
MLPDTENIFDPETLTLNPNILAARLTKDKRRTENQSRNRQRKLAEKIETEMGFFKGFFKDQLRLAKSCKCAPIAVQAVLQYLRYKKRPGDKGKPIEFNNRIMNALGYSHQAKLAALKKLETAGIVTVEWRTRKSPLVLFVREP